MSRFCPAKVRILWHRAYFSGRKGQFPVSVPLPVSGKSLTFAPAIRKHFSGGEITLPWQFDPVWLKVMGRLFSPLTHRTYSASRLAELFRIQDSQTYVNAHLYISFIYCFTKSLL